MNWLAWCANPAGPRMCIVTAMDLAYGLSESPARHLWVATLCNDRPRLGGPVSFGPTPPTEQPKLCKLCAERLAKMQTVTISLIPGEDPDAFAQRLVDFANKGPRS